jgi:hypothetical protein
MSLFSPEQQQALEAHRQCYLREHPEDRAAHRWENARRARILIEVAGENPDLTVGELAEYAERSPAWVRRILKKAGIVLAKPVRPTPVKARANRIAAAQAQAFWLTRVQSQAGTMQPTETAAVAPVEGRRFVYQVRSPEQWEARMKPLKTRQSRSRRAALGERRNDV